MESHDLEPRGAAKRAVKGLLVPRILHGAAGVLAAGSLARDSAVRYGASPEAVTIFANTIDVDETAGRVDDLRGPHGDAVVLTVARLVPEKGLDTLLRAAHGVRLRIAGSGPLRDELEREAGDNVSFLGELGRDELLQAYADADVFALLSRREPWGVVVNEAAAAGLPLVLSDRVGAAADLLRDGENGVLVPAEDAGAARAAIELLARDPALRARYGARSRELASAWGYDAMIDRFISAVRAAA
jgi:glycosyltransferase involved in cell wall biosynthesis